jgi:hypothetical protein
MISVSDCQLRIVAATADLLPVEARGTFLQRVTAELRGRRDFSDCDVEQAVRAALLDQSAARSPGGQGCGDAPAADLPSGATRRPPRTMRADPQAARER